LHRPYLGRDNPQLQAQLRHSGHRQRHLCRAPNLREAVEQSHPQMQCRYLALKRAGHHALAQAFEAVHLGLYLASSVVAAPLLPDPPPQPFAGSQRCIAHCCSHPGLFPRFTVLTRGNHRLGASLGNRRIVSLRCYRHRRCSHCPAVHWAVFAPEARAA